MIALAMAAAAAVAAGDSCVEALCNADVLEPYFEKLERKGQSPRSGRPLHILQIGDSHTAGDAITGAWRDILQTRYGGGGRGVLPPGRPYDAYLTRGVTASMSGGWKIGSTFGKGASDPRPPLGISGFSLTSTTSGARISLTADPEQRFNRFVVCAMAKPGAGSLSIRLGLRVEVMRLDSNTMRPECRTLRSDDTQVVADVIAEGGPVTITSWASFRDGEGGVALSNVGVVGSQLVHFARTDDAVVTEELRAYEPDLIVIAFGTNEGFAPRLSPWEYEIVLRTQIGRIRRLAGNVPILLMGAPDASTRRTELLRNAPAPTPAPCYGVSTASAAPAARPQTLATIMANLRSEEGASDAAAEPGPVIAPPAPVVEATPLFPPAALGVVRNVQRSVARSLHVAFWDWEARMGGRCSAVRWVRQSPAWMRGDYVHFNSAGGREIGSRLQADLDKAAARISEN